MEENNLLANYGIYTFNDKILKARVKEETYSAFHQALNEGKPLSKEVAAEIANAMKEWALALGATHFTHWFVPLTGLTAEKHDAFLELENDLPKLEFNGKLLRKGEPDASSFPSGGLRATFEARGYTSWDCTSNAFVKGTSLYIPTLFSSYTGEALDDKTPLLKSCDVLNKEAVKLLHLLGYNDVKSVTAYVGSEQEYFLVDEKYYNKRLDLRFTGRTLFGANAPKGQEFDDHYFANINARVSNFMNELDNELWKFGIPAKTKHNETAPAQHEIACIYRNVNLTADNNNLLMQLMQDIAEKHGLKCLLHEKPFAKVNGSGKHNNWSIITDTGLNLFKPGANPTENLAFLASLACVVKGVSEYADLLRLSIASYANDLRLGGNEAPPAIISLFLGSEIDGVIDAIITNKAFKNMTKNRFQTGVSVIPDFAKDTTDRNRTSPFAFTGNKFEFRGVGSSQTIATVNTYLNTILAAEMREMSELILAGNKPLDVIRSFLKEHQRIIFSGDGYSQEWQLEAAMRGLSNKTNAVDAFETLKDSQMMRIFKDFKIFTQIEIDSRYEVLLDNYSKTAQVESLTALKMLKNAIYPACLKYLNDITVTANNLASSQIDNSFILNDVRNIASLLKDMRFGINELEARIAKIQSLKENKALTASLWRDEVLSSMNRLRSITDELEMIVDKSYWPIPTYVDLLFGI